MPCSSSGTTLSGICKSRSSVSYPSSTPSCTCACCSPAHRKTRSPCAEPASPDQRASRYTRYSNPAPRTVHHHGTFLATRYDRQQSSFLDATIPQTPSHARPRFSFAVKPIVEPAHRLDTLWTAVPIRVLQRKALRTAPVARDPDRVYKQLRRRLSSSPQTLVVHAGRSFFRLN